MVMAGALICQGASSADAATAVAEHPCQPYADAISQLNQQAAAHNASRNVPRPPAQFAAYNAEARQGNAAMQRAASSLQLCLEQVQAAEAPAAQPPAQARAQAPAAQPPAQARAQAPARERTSTPGLGGTQPFVAPPVPAPNAPAPELGQEKHSASGAPITPGAGGGSPSAGGPTNGKGGPEADAAEKKARNVQLGLLHGYKKVSAADRMDDIERAELDSLIRKLELGEVSATEADRQRTQLLDQASARRKLSLVRATFLDGAKKHNVSNATGEKMDGIQAERQRLTGEKAKLAEERKNLATSLGPDAKNIDDRETIKKLRLEGKRVEAERLLKLDEQFKELDRQLHKLSEELGQVATQDFAEEQGASLLYEGRPGMKGTLDAVFYKPGRPGTLFVCEAKGGGGRLGTRSIEGLDYQQGTPEYLRWMLKNDQDFRTAADEAGLLKLIETGDVTVEYHLVHAKGGPDVLVNQFNITPRP
ncbi:MAG: hypothetical protein DLM60_03725 [Pseudonocardiales bacterium]|nr:MAG: hypothetical protein DLM60_03725 [Pseudonocardiales bacterium]